MEKNGGLSSELVMLGDEGNSLEVVEIVETQPVAAGMNLLANEEFEKESGGYQSEEEEDAPEQAKDAVQVEDSREVKKVSKKRKASKELKISKYVSSQKAQSLIFFYLIFGFVHSDVVLYICFPNVYRTIYMLCYDLIFRN